VSDIADLIRLAGRRPEPAAFRVARVRKAVEAEWRRTVDRRSRSVVWRWSLAAAALALAALWFRAASPPLAPRPADVATVVRVDGSARLASPASAVRLLAIGDRLVAGAAADTTAGGRLALQLASGIALRVKEGTRVVVEGPASVRLEHGTIYVDTKSGSVDPKSGASASRRMDVRTPQGTVYNVGTRFEVGAGSGGVRIRVRDGEVRVDRAGPEVRVIAAQAVTLHPDRRVEWMSEPPFGKDWSWVEAVAPPFVIEGATLERFLNWVSGELGLTWRYADRAAERYGRTVVLHGSIEGLTPQEALEAVVPTCGMSQRTSRGELIVARAAR
jgi:ferric-dicitrate binding protein FerR (iron transport regulator)